MSQSLGTHHTCLYVIVNNYPYSQSHQCFVLNAITLKIQQPRVAPRKKKTNNVTIYFFLLSLNQVEHRCVKVVYFNKIPLVRREGRWQVTRTCLSPFLFPCLQASCWALHRHIIVLGVPGWYRVGPVRMDDDDYMHPSRIRNLARTIEKYIRLRKSASNPPAVDTDEI